MAVKELTKQAYLDFPESVLHCDSQPWGQKKIEELDFSRGTSYTYKVTVSNHLKPQLKWCHETEVGGKWQQVTDVMSLCNHCTILGPHLLEYVTFYKLWNFPDAQRFHLKNGCWTWDAPSLKSFCVLDDFQESLYGCCNMQSPFLPFQIGNQLKSKYCRSKRKPGVVKVKEQSEPSINTKYLLILINQHP